MKTGKEERKAEKCENLFVENRFSTCQDQIQYRNIFFIEKEHKNEYFKFTNITAVLRARTSSFLLHIRLQARSRILCDIVEIVHVTINVPRIAL
jgi:hypothetical protein